MLGNEPKETEKRFQRQAKGELTEKDTIFYVDQKNHKQTDTSTCSSFPSGEAATACYPLHIFMLSWLRREHFYYSVIVHRCVLNTNEIKRFPSLITICCFASASALRLNWIRNIGKHRAIHTIACSQPIRQCFQPLRARKRRDSLC